MGETLTGARLATITPPAGSTFAGVTGAADDRTFVLDSVQLDGGLPGTLLPNQPRTWYLLRIRPGATPVQTLTPLHFPLPSGADVNGIALSPDGTKLAVLYQSPGTAPASPTTVRLPCDLLRRHRGGAAQLDGYRPGPWLIRLRRDGLPDPNANLTWTSDGQRLAFAYRNSNGPGTSLYLREVNLAGPGSDLFTDSTVIATIGVSTTNARSSTWCDSLGITGDGRSAVCGATCPSPARRGHARRADRVRRPLEGLRRGHGRGLPGAGQDLAGRRQARPGALRGRAQVHGRRRARSVLWSSPSGGTVLGAVSYADGPSTSDETARSCCTGTAPSPRSAGQAPSACCWSTRPPSS